MHINLIPPRGPWNTCEDRVLIALEDGNWHGGNELRHPDVGGWEATRRIRALRARGWNILQRRAADGYEYRLEGTP